MAVFLPWILGVPCWLLDIELTSAVRAEEVRREVLNDERKTET